MNSRCARSALRRWRFVARATARIPAWSFAGSVRAGSSARERTEAARRRRSRVFTQECVEAAEGGVPLAGDFVEVIARFFEAFGAQFPDAFAAFAGVVHEPGIGEGAEVFGDGLARDVRAFAQAHDRKWPL